MTPKVISGGKIFDNRGSVQFNNTLILKILSDFIVHNYAKNFVRAWTFKEEKYIICIKGTFQISAVKLDNIKTPVKNKIYNFYLNENDNKFLYIPKNMLMAQCH